MAAGRTTGNGNEVRVAALVGDVRPDPREGALDVNDVIGPRVARAVPVIDRHADPPQLRKVAHQWMACPRLFPVVRAPPGIWNSTGALPVRSRSGRRQM